MKACKTTESAPSEDSVWTPTSVQFLYRHRNGRYYVRTFAHGKEKWASLKTNLLSIAKNRMREHIDATEKQRLVGESVDADGILTFGQAMRVYRSHLEEADIRPNTKVFRESGLKLVLRTWDGIEKINVRKITSRAVENWLRDVKDTAKPYVPNGAKTASRNSTGASVTTLKCALDSFRHVLDVAVDTGHLYANPARNAAVTEKAKKLFKVVRREKAQRGSLRLPTRSEFSALVEVIRNAGVSDCRAAADYVQFIAFSGARKTEASHVTWADIDLTREMVRLRVTKNGEERFVPMIAEMRELLTRLKSERSTKVPTDPVLKIKDVQGFINSSCKKLCISRFTTHALRHLFGTACLEAGVDVPTVAEWLGHKDKGALLLKIYSHVRRQHQTEMVKKVRFSQELEINTPML